MVDTGERKIKVQESLFNTVQKLQTEQKVNVEELEILLNSDIEEVVSLCKKACLKPKTDTIGNAFFTKDDVDILKKMKELYSQSQEVKSQIENQPEKEIEKDNENILDSSEKRINFLTKAKSRMKSENPLSLIANSPSYQIKTAMDKLENNLISKMSEILSEKMDGFDEIIVELIRSKTENENLRQQVNTLNKQLFIMKKELASYSPVAFGFYTKKDM